MDWKNWHSSTFLSHFISFCTLFTRLCHQWRLVSLHMTWWRTYCGCHLVRRLILLQLLLLVKPYLVFQLWYGFWCHHFILDNCNKLLWNRFVILDLVNDILSIQKSGCFTVSVHALNMVARLIILQLTFVCEYFVGYFFYCWSFLSNCIFQWVRNPICFLFLF